jgi:formylglycine-generating enzyme required for sulfatase activity
VIAVIGIDRYQHESWRPLTNAVADARGAAELFGKLGFEQVAALFDEQATSEAVEGLVTDDLKTLGPNDSLVLFYAGHGSTQSHQLGSQVVNTGHLIPFDASDRTATWIDLDGWLRAVSLLPAKHILVILDACHSGIALGQVTKWRGGAEQQDTPLSTLRARRSRRIITSAMDNEVALDGGPVHGHSLFTGCLIEALTHGVGRPGSRVITGSELGLYLQDRVEKYPRSRQTPDFGTFDFDERGEMVLPFVMASKVPELGPPGDGATPDDQVKVVADKAVGDHDRRRRRVILAGAAGAALALLAYNMRDQRTAHRSVEATPAAPVDAPPDPPGVAESSQPRIAQGGCPAGMVRVPAGTFRMGSPDEEGGANEHPQHEVTLSPYCIDRTEVTVREYRACVAADGCSATPVKMDLQLSLFQASVRVWCNGADRPEHPMNCVSWEQAAAYCKRARKRLPTEAEWEYAARGADGRTYPWGDQPPNASRLNACGNECVLMAERDLKLEWNGMYNDNDGWPMTAPVGSYHGGASPFGALDMAGNVWEWTADSYGPYTGEAATNPQYPEGGTRAYRGGGWISMDASSVRATTRSASASQQGHLSMGFRCARED